jgi:EpsI family protein
MATLSGVDQFRAGLAVIERVGASEVGEEVEEQVGMNAKSTAWLIAALTLTCGALIAGNAAYSFVKDQPNFLHMVPKTFGERKEVEDSTKIIEPASEETYAEMLSRTYVNEDGYRIMMSLVRSRHDIQQARPEVCYPAHGFKLLGLEKGALSTPFGPIEVRRLTTSMGSRSEPVTYWYAPAPLSRWDLIRMRWDVMWSRGLLVGWAPGLLFRVSSIDRDPVRAFTMQQKFVVDMMAFVPPETGRKLTGHPNN